MQSNNTTEPSHEEIPPNFFLRDFVLFPSSTDVGSDPSEDESEDDYYLINPGTLTCECATQGQTALDRVVSIPDFSEWLRHDLDVHSIRNVIDASLWRINDLLEPLTDMAQCIGCEFQAAHQEFIQELVTIVINKCRVHHRLLVRMYKIWDSQLQTEWPSSQVAYAYEARACSDACWESYLSINLVHVSVVELMANVDIGPSFERESWIEIRARIHRLAGLSFELQQRRVVW